MNDRSSTPTRKKLEELYELIDSIEIAHLTTRRPDGRLVSRPMATQEQGDFADLWFVTSVETHKVDEIEANPEVCVAYYDNDSREWVSVSGNATVCQDRAKIRELYEPDWKMWFSDEGGARDGGPDDPRLALIFVDAVSVAYMKSDESKARVLFELARGFVTGESPDIGREEQLSPAELQN